MNIIFGFIVKHRLSLILALLAVAFSVIVGYVSNNKWILLFTILTTLFPVVIWVNDTHKADIEYDKLNQKYKELEEANAIIKQKNEMIYEKNNHFSTVQLEKSLLNFGGRLCLS